MKQFIGSEEFMKLKYYDENGNIKILEEVEEVVLVRNNTKFMVSGKFKEFDIDLNKFIEVYI